MRGTTSSGKIEGKIEAPRWFALLALLWVAVLPACTATPIQLPLTPDARSAEAPPPDAGMYGGLDRSPGADPEAGLAPLDAAADALAGDGFRDGAADGLEDQLIGDGFPEAAGGDASAAPDAGTGP